MLKGVTVIGRPLISFCRFQATATTVLRTVTVVVMITSISMVALAASVVVTFVSTTFVAMLRHVLENYTLALEEPLHYCTCSWSDRFPENDEQSAVFCRDRKPWLEWQRDYSLVFW